MTKKLAALTLLLTTALCSAQTGADLAAVFAKAKAGAPLRYVALGGSITQSGEGWIGPWLREQFPDSNITVVNSGMSATGSRLGVFRVQRDVIDYEPDLVAIEYCVNDGGVSDEDAIRDMESLIVRLKSLPNPPAIIILEAAAQGGVNLARHRKVARHYGLVEVDLQQATDDYLAQTGKAWGELFKDRVHPNTAGNAFYSEAIARVLKPYLNQPAPDKTAPLPQPLSTHPLILDGRMVDLSSLVQIDGWKQTPSFATWWGRFFRGALSATEPGTTLSLNVSGTTIGLYYAMGKDYGTFYASVDDAMPTLSVTNSRGGYGYGIYASNLDPGKHTLNVVLPPAQNPALNLNGPVHLGYLLLAGVNSTTTTSAPSGGKYPLAWLAKLRFTPVPLNTFQWAGPYQPADPNAKDGESAMATAFAPESNPGSVTWKMPTQADGPGLDFRALTGNDAPTVNYVKGTINSPEARPVLLSVTVDYFVKVWLNGQLVVHLDGPHGSSARPVFIPVDLKKGDNDLLVKVGAGSQGNRLSLSIGTSD